MKLKDRSYGDLFEQSREAVLDAVAGAVEAHDRLRRFARETSDEESEPGDESDFLYDLARLNVQYLNQLARIGSNYAILGSRILESVYEKVVPKGRPVPPGGSDDLRFFDADDQELRRQPLIVLFGSDEDITLDFPVQNPFDEPARLQLSFVHPQFLEGRPVDGDDPNAAKATRIAAVFGLLEPKATLRLALRPREKVTVPVSVLLCGDNLSGLELETDYFNGIEVEARTQPQYPRPDRVVGLPPGVRSYVRYIVVRRCAVAGEVES
jgi:hypothetical protein